MITKNPPGEFTIYQWAMDRIKLMYFFIELYRYLKKNRASEYELTHDGTIDDISEYSETLEEITKTHPMLIYHNYKYYYQVDGKYEDVLNNFFGKRLEIIFSPLSESFAVKLYMNALSDDINFKHYSHIWFRADEMYALFNFSGLVRDKLNITADSVSHYKIGKNRLEFYDNEIRKFMINNLRQIILSIK
jgi:hypothetical protein